MAQSAQSSSLPVVPMRNAVLFPGVTFPISAGRAGTLRGIEAAISTPERLVFATSALEDDQGNPQLEGVTTVTFTERDGKTKLTLHVVMVKAEPGAEGALDGMEEGWNQSLDKLVEYLAKA